MSIGKSEIEGPKMEPPNKIHSEPKEFEPDTKPLIDKNNEFQNTEYEPQTKPTKQKVVAELDEKPVKERKAEII